MVAHNLTIAAKEFVRLPRRDTSRIVEARLDAFRARGCDIHSAFILALRTAVSVDEAAHLLERGCDARTVLRTLT